MEICLRFFFCDCYKILGYWLPQILRSIIFSRFRKMNSGRRISKYYCYTSVSCITVGIYVSFLPNYAIIYTNLLGGQNLKRAIHGTVAAILLWKITFYLSAVIIDKPQLIQKCDENVSLQPTRRKPYLCLLLRWLSL